MQLYNIIRSAGGGEIVRNLAAGSGLEPSEVEETLRALLPEMGSAIRRAGESRSGAAAHAVMRDERYRRYFENPPTLAEPAAVADGERVLDEILAQGERSELVRRVAAAIGPDEGRVRALLSRVAVLAAAVLGERLREPPAAPASPRRARRGRASPRVRSGRDDGGVCGRTGACDRGLGSIAHQPGIS